MHSKFPFKLIIAGFFIWCLLAFMAINFAASKSVSHSSDIHIDPVTQPAVIESSPVAATTEKTLQAEEPEAVRKPKHTSITGVLRPGESLDASLKRLQLQTGLRSKVIKAFSTCLNFKKLRPNDNYTVVIDEQGELVSCTYESSPLDIFTVVRSEDGFSARKIPVSVESRTVFLTGKIKSNLFAAFSELGEKAKIVHAFADIFSSKIDFNTEPRIDDNFSLVVEKFYKDGKFIGYGKILHAKYDGFCGTFEGFYYGSDTTRPSHFDPQGREVGTSFLRSPIPFGRVSSGFTWKRKHPILGTTRPHLGVDLTAPRGTPIMAAADGIIEFVGRNGGFGKQVIIKHPGGYKTHYGHLSRFGKGIRKGKRVRQKDIIGYVGSTGLSTGPHLDYRIQEQGIFKNPFSIKFKPKTVLKGEELQKFTDVRDSLNQLLANQQPGSTLLVKEITVESGKNVIL
jgi:murein DD-endopeptidase MepM/ murein hydrolase activator NlpD